MKVRLVWAIGGALLAAAVLPATARAETSFTAFSSATALDVTVSNDDLPLLSAVQAGGPSAGASLDSTGQGTAYAANPYPGTTVAQLPGTAAGLAGLPIPAYPLFVATTSDDEPAAYAQPGIALHATCRLPNGRGCRSSSLAGVAPGTTEVRASVVQPSDDYVVVTARADFPDLALPGGVALSGVHTSATAVLDKGVLTRSSRLSVSRLTIGGTEAFRISDGRVTAGGSDVAVPFAELADALASAGVEAELVAASTSRYGVVAPVLRLRTVVPAAPGGLAKPITVVYTLGGAEATVAAGAFRVDVVPGVGIGRPGSPDGGPASGAAGRPPMSGADLDAPLPGVTAAGPAQEPGPEAPLAQVTPAASPAQPFDVSDIYLAIVLCGVVWFGATQALRVIGVRFRWMS